MALVGYPKQVVLRDGGSVLLRQVGFEDGDALLALYRGLPEADRRALRDDVARTEWSERFLTKVALGDVLSLVAEVEGHVVAEASLYRQRHGWSAHVGELRVSVDAAQRGRGLGLAMLRELGGVAARLGLERLVAQMVEEQGAARAFFTGAGLVEEARLHGQVKDAEGRRHDLLIFGIETGDLQARLSLD